MVRLAFDQISYVILPLPLSLCLTFANHSINLVFKNFLIFCSGTLFFDMIIANQIIKHGHVFRCCQYLTSEYGIILHARYSNRRSSSASVAFCTCTD